MRNSIWWCEALCESQTLKDVLVLFFSKATVFKMHSLFPCGVGTRAADFCDFYVILWSHQQDDIVYGHFLLLSERLVHCLSMIFLSVFNPPIWGPFPEAQVSLSPPWSDVTPSLQAIPRIHLARNIDFFVQTLPQCQRILKYTFLVYDLSGYMVIINITEASKEMTSVDKMDCAIAEALSTLNTLFICTERSFLNSKRNILI